MQVNHLYFFCYFGLKTNPFILELRKRAALCGHEGSVQAEGMKAGLRGRVIHGTSP